MPTITTRPPLAEGLHHTQEAGLGIYVEVSVDVEHGMADDQLGQMITCGLITGLRFFDALAERFSMAEQTEGDA